MSAGYAARLKEYPNKGVCGLVELKETSRAYKVKIQQLTTLMRQSKHVVVLTGAGISTAAGIPDFRGPKGIWTLEQKREQQAKKKRKRLQRKREDVDEVKDDETNARNVGSTNTACATESTSTDSTSTSIAEVVSSSSTSIATLSSSQAAEPTMDFAAAQPTFTHFCLTRLVSDGLIQFVITQNVDGLHRRSGLTRDSHAILHGCAFTETCRDCDTEHFRDFDIGGMSFQTTGRTCEAACCTGDLCDTLLDWEDPLPEHDLERSEQHCDRADLAICLGTSLRIQPASNLPLRAKQFVIVNLQKTPMDAQAALLIHERVDTVLQDLLAQLGYADGADWDKLPRPPIERLWKPKDTTASFES